MEFQKAEDSAFEATPVSAQGEWCASLPLVGTRSLLSAERAELERVAGGWGGWKWGCGVPVGIVLGFFAMISIGGAAVDRIGGALGETIINSLLIGFFFASMVALGAMLLLGRDRAQAKNQSRGDLRDGQIDIYQGVPLTLLEPQNEEDEWILSDLLPEQQRVDSQHRIEVLHHSRRLWSLDGKRVTERIELPVSRLAPVPPAARTAAAWTSPPHGATHDESYLNRRALSDAERDELTRHARRWKKGILPAVLLGAWIGIPLTLHLATKTPWRVEPMAYVVGAMAIWSFWKLGHGALQSQQFRRDSTVGEVLVMRLTDEERLQSGVEIVEILPASQLEWTWDGQAAPWRHLPA